MGSKGRLNLTLRVGYLLAIVFGAYFNFFSRDSLSVKKKIEKIEHSHSIFRRLDQMIYIILGTAQFSQSCPTLCDPMNRSMPGLPVHHRLPEFTQTHAIESVMPSSHLILCHPPSPPAPNPSKHQSLFQ